jgi:hypothetical protein
VNDHTPYIFDAGAAARKEREKNPPPLSPEDRAIAALQPERWRRLQRERAERAFATSERGQQLINEKLTQHNDAIAERKRLSAIVGSDVGPRPGELADGDWAYVAYLAGLGYDRDEGGIDLSPERTLADVRAEADALELTGKRADLLASAQRAVARLEEATEGIENE